MGESNFNVLNERCENLRWKGLFIDGGEGISTTGTPPIFWCLKTQLGIGPDGQLVGREECGPDRSCFRDL